MSDDNNKKELQRLRNLRNQKQGELDKINSQIHHYETLQHDKEIQNESNFNAWKLAKKELEDNDDISDKFKEKLKKLEEDYWKKCLNEALSYEEEYLCIMQYHLICGINAEMARSHRKGTFGYWLRNMTEEEHKKMNDIEWKNFQTYLKQIKFDEYDEFEDVNQDGEGGWYFSELEDK